MATGLISERRSRFGQLWDMVRVGLKHRQKLQSQAFSILFLLYYYVLHNKIMFSDRHSDVPLVSKRKRMLGTFKNDLRGLMFLKLLQFVYYTFKNFEIQ